MIEVLYMDKGRVTIPKDSRKRHDLQDGDTLLFQETASGAMVLHPVKTRPEKSLFEHLRNFSDVKLPARKAHCPPRT